MTGSASGFRGGLWRANPVLVRLLGLSPALAMTRSLATALALGVATLGVLVASRSAMALVERRLSAAMRLPAQLLLIAAATGCVDLLLQAYRYPLHQQLGIFVPLIAANGALLWSSGDGRGSPGTAAADALGTGLGFLAVLTLLGALRELAGQGTLGSGMELLFGAVAAGWKIQLLPAGYGFPLWLLPSGAFVLVGLMIALRNAFALRQHPPAPEPPVPVPGAKRVRVTDPAPGD